MNKIWAVVRREFLERVRTKAFILGTFLFPIFIVGISVVPALLMTRTTGTKRVAVVDGASGEFGAKVEDAMAAAQIGEGDELRSRYRVTRYPVTEEQLDDTRDELIARTGLSRAADTTFDGVLVLTDAGLMSGRLQYFGDDAGSLRAIGDLQGLLRPVVTRERLEREGVDPTTVMRVIGPVNLATQKVSDGKLTGQSGQATFMLAYAMGFILYMALLLYGVQTMNSIVEEKSNRIMEILASSMSPFQMLLGKVLGVGAVALLQIGIWGGSAYLFTSYRVQILGAFGVDASGGALALAIPTIPGDLLAVFLLFFVLGFLLYSAMYAAVGAMCNTVQETQQAQFPVMFLILLGLMTMFALLNDPNSSVAQTLSYVPFWTPFVLPVRYSMSPVPLPQLAASVVATILGMLAIVWLAGRIYRVGILSYGKRASVRELWRWIRTA